MNERDLLLRELLADHLVGPIDDMGDLIVYRSLDAIHYLACLGAHVWPSSFGTEVQVNAAVYI